MHRHTPKLCSSAPLLALPVQVVCSTCTGAGDPQLSSHTFKVVVIDEATQVEAV